jgi:hypothetical protein
LTGRLLSHAIVGVNRFSTASLQFTRVIPEIDIWRAANLMLKRYGGKAFEESSTRADERWRVDVAPDYRCRSAARQQRTARPGSLIGADPETVGTPLRGSS